MKNNPLKTILCIGLLWMACIGSAEAKKQRVKVKQMYMIGVAVSHLDSVLFLSDLQMVDSLTIEKKTKFLMDRQLYSFQFQRYLEQTYECAPYVPAVFFSPKRKKMERRYLSMHKRYSQDMHYRVILVDQSQFRFKPEQYIEQELPSVTKKKKK